METKKQETKKQDQKKRDVVCCPYCFDGLCPRCGGLLSALEGCDDCSHSGLCRECNGVGVIEE